MNKYEITFQRENRGDSMKHRWEYAEQQMETLKEDLQKDIINYKAAYAAARRIADDKDAEIAALKERTLSADDIADISRLLAQTVLNLGKEVSNVADRIVEAADQPESAAFRNAVNDHRAAKADLDRYTGILSRVNTAKNSF